MSYISSINKAWKIVPFGKVVRRSQYGLSESATEDGAPYLKMSNIRDGKVIVEGADRLKVDEKTLDDYALKDGDLVFNRTNSLDLVGKTGVFRGDEKVVFASYLVRFQLHDNKADSRFIAAWFASAGAAHRLRCLATPGVSQSNINPTTLRLSMHVPCPPLPEQRKIADILTTWDKALEKLDALIEAQERRKKALMQQLLTGQRRLPGFTRKWEGHRFGQLMKSEDRYSKFDDDKLYHLVSARRRAAGVFFREALHGKDIKTKVMKRVHAGDFLISRMQVVHGGLGCVPPECDGFYASDSYEVLVPQDKTQLCSRFIGHLSRLREFWHRAYKCSHGVHIEKMTFVMADFEKEKFTIPVISEQKAISDVIDVADKEIQLLQQQRTALDQQKRGLMQKLLTGKIRVIKGS